MPVRLDPRDARPLTSREISKVLTSVLDGVASAYPEAVPVFPDAMAAVAVAAQHPVQLGNARAALRAVSSEERFANNAGWFTALAATIGGMRQWCALADVDTAVAYISENLHKRYALPS